MYVVYEDGFGDIEIVYVDCVVGIGVVVFVEEEGVYVGCIV